MDINKIFTFWKKPRWDYSVSLEKNHGVSIDIIIEIIKSFLINKSKLFSSGKYEYRILGGANNYGFVSYISKNASWVVKIAPDKLLRREALFFEYHKKSFNENTGFAPDSMGFSVLKDTGLAFLVLENMKESKKTSLNRVYDLYSESKCGKELFDMGLLENVPKLNAGTRIKDILIFLVCDFKSNEARNYIDVFFFERMRDMPEYSDEIFHIQSVIKKKYEALRNFDESLVGFVHGDFKESNMMISDNDRLKLIDFQYYCKGIEVWDLAFYLSKSKLSFSNGVELILNKLPTKNEKNFLLFFYVFALLLHSKSSAFKKDKFKPVLKCLSKY